TISSEPEIGIVYKTLAPFPPLKSITKNDLERVVCKTYDKDMMSKNYQTTEHSIMKVSDEVSAMVPSINMVPSIKTYVKDMMSKNYQTTEHSIMKVSDEVSAMIHGETPTKQPDPRSFVLDSLIRDVRFPCSLCDIVSSVNLM